MDSYKFKMQVFSEDTDSFGIVHHANFIKFMERARLKWLLSLGFRLDKLFAQGLFFVIRKIDIEYLTPARLYDELEIVSKVIRTRRVETVYEQVIHNAQDPNILYCKAIIHVVCVNNKMRPQAMPRELLERCNDN